MGVTMHASPIITNYKYLILYQGTFDVCKYNSMKLYLSHNPFCNSTYYIVYNAIHKEFLEPI